MLRPPGHGRPRPIPCFRYWFHFIFMYMCWLVYTGLVYLLYFTLVLHLQGAALTRQRQEQLIGCLQEQESQRTQEQEAPEQPTRGTDEVMRDAFGTSSDEDEDEHGGAQSSSDEDEEEQVDRQGMCSRRPATGYSYIGVEFYLQLDEI